MRLACPHCGERSLEEFAYLGDANVTRPDATAPDALGSYIAYTFERTNPPGPHRELWQHAMGCRAWLVVTRNVATHEILAVEPARDVALVRPSATGSSTP